LVYAFALDGGYLYITDYTTMSKVDASTGEIVLTWAASGSFTDLAAADGYLYATDPAGTTNIKKYDVTTGTQVVGGGWPIAGSFDRIAAGGGFLYAVDGSSDIRKYNVTNGVEDTGGDFRLAGTFGDIATDGTNLYAIDLAGTDDIRKFACADGVESLTGFPIAGDFDYIGVAGEHLYATVDTTRALTKYDTETGELVFSDDSRFFSQLDGDDSYLGAGTSDGYVRIRNAGEGYNSTAVDSSDGTARFHEGTFSDLTATGDTDLQGPASIDNHLITLTRGRRTANLGIATGTPTSVNGWNTFDGSSSTGDTDFWTESGGVFTITKAGVYRIGVSVLWDSNATGYRAFNLLTPNAPFSPIVSDYRPAVNGNVTRMGREVELEMAVGDTITLQVLQTSGGSLALAAGSWQRSPDVVARIIIPPRAVGAGTSDIAAGKYLAYVETAVYVPAKNRMGIELPEIAFYEADPSDNAQQIRAALEKAVREVFGAPANTSVVWLNA
jgi:hypothetical protein